jgi:type IV secretion system protein VirB5
MAFGGLALSTGLSGGLLWQSMQSRVTPYVVEVDKLGEARAVAPAVADWTPADPQIAFHLARFIEHVRSIPADPVVLREDWLSAYDFASAAGARALNDYARSNDPFAEVGRFQVAIDVSSVIRASKDSFRIAWSERRYQGGSLIETSRWSAILTIRIDPPRTPDALRKNPLGLFVTALSWSKELSQ